jgi:hypothetical protein
VAEPNTSVRLHVRDRVTGELFLVNTGAEISLLPAGNVLNKTPSSFKLYTANDTQINTFGESFRTLHLYVSHSDFVRSRGISASHRFRTRSSGPT